MENLLLQAAEILTPVYLALPPAAWGIILAGLILVLIALRILRRRRAVPAADIAQPAPPRTLRREPDPVEPARQESAPQETPGKPDDAAPAQPLEEQDQAAIEKPVPAQTGIKAPPLAPDRAARAKSDARAPREAAAPSAPSPKGLFNRLKQGLAKTRRALNIQIEDLFSGRGQLDDDLIEELEEMLISADVGVQTALELMAKIGRRADSITSPEDLKNELRRELRALIPDPSQETAYGHQPHVIMVVGVNGVGKTTTIGKLAHRHQQAGQRVLIAAADTFRAAAVEQLEIWCDRAGAELIKHKANSDPAAVAFDGVQAAVARKAELLIIDTAGRLHTKVNLMEELKKIRRAVDKNLPGAPHEILLVLDATTGQNALSQAKLFHEAMGLTGIALTKLDGTAKGGIVFSICDTLKLPLQYIGVGEKMHDLQPFDPDNFVDALF